MNKIDEIALRVKLRSILKHHGIGPDGVIEGDLMAAFAELSKDAEPAGYQRRLRYKTDAQWEQCATHEATDFWDVRPEYEYRKIFTHPANTAEIEQRISELETINAKLKLEAQIHAQEATTANATIAEIYQFVTGSTGEPGNWNGAIPVKEKFAEIEQRVAEACAKLNEDYFPHKSPLVNTAIRSGKWREYL